jgi:hypothetical protein
MTGKSEDLLQEDWLTKRSANQKTHSNKTDWW